MDTDSVCVAFWDFVSNTSFGGPSGGLDDHCLATKRRGRAKMGNWDWPWIWAVQYTFLRLLNSSSLKLPTWPALDSTSLQCSFHGLHQRSNPTRPDPLSPGPVSPEADLCGESSRHHMLVLCPYELYLLEQLGLWHRVWRTQQNKDLSRTRCSTVLPDHPLCFVLDVPQIVTLPVERGCLFVCQARDNQSDVFTNRF